MVTHHLPRYSRGSSRRALPRYATARPPDVTGGRAGIENYALRSTTNSHNEDNARFALHSGSGARTSRAASA